MYEQVGTASRRREFHATVVTGLGYVLKMTYNSISNDHNATTEDGGDGEGWKRISLEKCAKEGRKHLIRQVVTGRRTAAAPRV